MMNRNVDDCKKQKEKIREKQNQQKLLFFSSVFLFFHIDKKKFVNILLYNTV